MIDYLELILDAQEQDEFGNKLSDVELVHPPLVPHTARRAPEENVPGADSQTANSVEVGISTPQEIFSPDIFAAPLAGKGFIQPHQTDRDTLWDTDFLSGGRHSFSLYFSDGNSTQTASRPWVTRAYRESVLTAQAAVSLRQGARRTVTVSVPDTVAALAPSVSKLDEAFARDARRYDGGFSMY